MSQLVASITGTDGDRPGLAKLSRSPPQALSPAQTDGVGRQANAARAKLVQEMGYRHGNA